MRHWTAQRPARTLVELCRLREPWADIHALGFLAEHQSSVDTQEQLERVWRDSAPLFEERRDLPANRLQRAMIQAAQNKADVLREASLAYGQITSPESGLYYLGEAVGQARLASFLRGLDGGANGASSRSAGPRSLVASLRSMDWRLRFSKPNRQVVRRFRSAPD